MNNDFMKALKFTSKWEGWYSDDKTDPGGKTKFGVSDMGDGTMDGLIDIDRNGTGDVPVPDLTWEQAINIYYKSYWLAAKCNDLSLADAVARFDAAVNCGVSVARGWGTDYKMINTNRKMYYMRIIQKKPALNKYHKGWLNRLVDLAKYCDILTVEASGS